MADAHANAAYFDTPARAERLQLLLHLIRNVGDVIYLRAPAGAGKTRFTRRLLEVVGDEAACVWLRGGIDNEVTATTASQLGLAAHDVADWPSGVIRALAGQDLLVVVDDADHLGLAAIERLATLHAAGGRLLLVGHGGLAQTTRQWDVHYVDLPPFDAEQSATFLRSNAGDEADHINDDLAAFLHHAAHGRPGALLDSLEEVLARVRRQAEQRGLRSADRDVRRPPWLWLGGGLAVFAIAAVLLSQDSINALFEVAPPPPPAVVRQPSVLAPDSEPDMSPRAAAGSAALAELATPDEPLIPMPPAESGVADSPQMSTAGRDSSEVASVAAIEDPVPDTDTVTPPAISLPELSRLSGPQEETDDVGSQPDTALQAAADAEVAPADDPLLAVMRDALNAAESDAVAADAATGTPDPIVPDGARPEVSAPPAPAEAGSGERAAAAKATAGQRVLRVIADAQPAATPAPRPAPEKPVPATSPAPLSERSVLPAEQRSAAPAAPAAAPTGSPAAGPAP
ncbi:MAG: ATP-binding protein, partial [Gammaproteobacteria bacterium]|nr:ATP-binding protein [Gammaproteobacteria bacterium]